MSKAEASEEPTHSNAGTRTNHVARCAAGSLDRPKTEGGLSSATLGDRSASRASHTPEKSAGGMIPKHYEVATTTALRAAQN